LDLATRYRDVLVRIKSAAESRLVTLIAVSKTQPAEAIETLYALGHRDFGENYVQELCEKAVELERRGCSGIRWHMIGHLQTNKVKQLVPHVFCVHSVSSEKLARELARRWKEARGPGTRLPVFIEVNIDSEDSKHGLLPADVPPLTAALAPISELSVEGLMCIPAAQSAGGEGDAFKRLRALSNECRPLVGGKLSMGMTQDFEAAIREGATHVRVGTAIFGSRA
jgi:PLP dependent protein